MTNDTPTSTDDERDKETAARIREINLLLIDGKCTPEYAYERIEEIVKEQLNANQPQTDEVTPTPVGEFNYRPAVSVRSDNQPQTELDEILDQLYQRGYQSGLDRIGLTLEQRVAEAKQALHQWAERKYGERDAAVTRFEVIDRRDRSLTFGRAFMSHGANVELSYQDGGRTLKVFVDTPTPNTMSSTDSDDEKFEKWLDEILHHFFVNAPQYDDDISVKKAATAKANAKQALLDWHNKQVEEVQAKGERVMTEQQSRKDQYERQN